MTLTCGVAALAGLSLNNLGGTRQGGRRRGLRQFGFSTPGPDISMNRAPAFLRRTEERGKARDER